MVSVEYWFLYHSRRSRYLQLLDLCVRGKAASPRELLGDAFDSKPTVAILRVASLKRKLGYAWPEWLWGDLQQPWNVVSESASSDRLLRFRTWWAAACKRCDDQHFQRWNCE
jgi:hypothetical protein